MSSPQGRFAAGAALLDGHTMIESQAHGKHLFLHFDHALVLHVHLGLYGAWDFGGDAAFRGASSIGAPGKSASGKRSTTAPPLRTPARPRRSVLSGYGSWAGTAGRTCAAPPPVLPLPGLKHQLSWPGWDRIRCGTCRRTGNAL